MDSDLPFDIHQEYNADQLLEDEEDQKKLWEHMKTAKESIKKVENTPETITIENFNKKITTITQTFTQLLSTYKDINQQYDDLQIRTNIEGSKSQEKLRKITTEWVGVNKNFCDCNVVMQKLYTDLILLSSHVSDA